MQNEKFIKRILVFFEEKREKKFSRNFPSFGFWKIIY